jgi:hypothetical protein
MDTQIGLVKYFEVQVTLGCTDPLYEHLGVDTDE